MKKSINNLAKEDNFTKIQQSVFWLINICFLFAVICILTRISSARPGNAPTENQAHLYQNDLFVLLLQTLAGLILNLLPAIVKKLYQDIFPNWLYLTYSLFIFSAIFLGNVRFFYDKYFWWDSFLHLFSSILITFTGFYLIAVINSNNEIHLILSPFFCALFSFCFALAAGVFWEIYEYTSDGIFNLNTQRYLLSDGQPLVGRAALSDTMKDIIINSAGALLAAISGYFVLDKRQQNISRQIDHS